MFKKELEKLFELQEIDINIFDLEEEIASFPGRKKQMEKEISDTLAKNEAASKEHKKLQLERKEKELELEGLETEIKKLQTRINEVKTNKEYTAILSEIENLKTRRTRTEDLILSVMDKDDTISVQLKKLSENHAKLTGDVALKIKEETEKNESIMIKLKDLKEKRKDIVPGINKDIYLVYERILRGKKNGMAMCRLENGNCAGCRVFVPTYIEEKVKEKKELVHCENCSRILY